MSAICLEAPPADLSGAGGPKKTVLVAEDDRLARGQLCALLADDYDVLEARDGAEALELYDARAGRIDVLTEPTGDRQELNRAIRRASGGGGTRLYDAVEFTLRQKLAKLGGRKAVVILTDGVDTTSRRASYQSTLRLAEETDALVYPVSYGGFGRSSIGGLGQPRIPLPGGGGIIIGGPRGPGAGGGGPTAGDYARGEAYLTELAQRTGGRLYRGNSVVNISQAFEWMVDELRRQYSLGYYPKAGGRDGQRRQIKVQVSQPNLVVQARDSYIFSQKKTEATGKEGEQQAQPDSPRQRLDGVR